MTRSGLPAAAGTCPRTRPSKARPSPLPRPEPEERLYSLDEARALLPVTVRRLEQIAELRGQMRAWGSAAEGISPADGEAPGLDELLSSINARLRDLTDKGILVRDLRSGIIDFPGRDAEGPLCWCFRLGESDIGYWHRPDEGFAGRKPVAEDP